MVAAEEGWCDDYTVRSFRAWWYLHGMELGSRAHLEQVLPLRSVRILTMGLPRPTDPAPMSGPKAGTDAAHSYGITGKDIYRFPCLEQVRGDEHTLGANE